MRTRHILPSILFLSCAALSGCGDDSAKPGGGSAGGATSLVPAMPSAPPPSPAPERIAVDHILIGVRNPRNPQGRRTESDAKAFAYELLRKLRAGADWETTKRENSEDPPPGGPYQMANRGVAPSAPIPTEFPRDQMVPAFGNVGFQLNVGDIGMADFSPTASWFGFHIIKRVR